MKWNTKMGKVVSLGRSSEQPVGFSTDEHLQLRYKAEPSRPEPILVCRGLEILAKTRNEDDEDWGRRLRITDENGNTKHWNMPRALRHDPKKILRELDRLGLVIENGAEKLLLSYIERCHPSAYVRTLSKSGWFRNAFVLPDGRVFGDAGQ